MTLDGVERDAHEGGPADLRPRRAGRDRGRDGRADVGGLGARRPTSSSRARTSPGPGSCGRLGAWTSIPRPPTDSSAAPIPRASGVAARRGAALIARWTGARVLRGRRAGGRPARAPNGSRCAPSRATRAPRLSGRPRRRRRGVRRPPDDPSRPTPTSIEVEVPGYRVDIEREVDLIEEVVRIQGYERRGRPRMPALAAARGARRTRTRSPAASATPWSARGSARPSLFPSSSEDDLALMGDTRRDPAREPAPGGGRRGSGHASLPGLLHAVARNQRWGSGSVVDLRGRHRVPRRRPGRGAAAGRARPVRRGGARAGRPTIGRSTCWTRVASSSRCFDDLGIEPDGTRGRSARRRGGRSIRGARRGSFSTDGPWGSLGELHPRVARRSASKAGSRSPRSSWNLCGLRPPGPSDSRSPSVPTGPAGPGVRGAGRRAGGSLQAAVEDAGGELLGPDVAVRRLPRRGRPRGARRAWRSRSSSERPTGR